MTPPAYSADMLELSRAVGAALRARGETCATAESCTGGLIGAVLTALPGSSDTYLGGVISYANSIKTAVLGVPASILETDGAVSDPTASEMASGVLDLTGADWGLSVTGIAGPTGGSPDKPVGLVFIGLAGPDTSLVRRFEFAGDRDSVRTQATAAALGMLIETLDSMPERSATR